jgi:Spy/CpxP family protein refolding chaperone
MLRPRALLLALALTASVGVTHAQSLVGPSSTAWGSLNPTQRGVLAPLERDWSQITPAQQQKWVEVANRYSTMTPDERGRAQERMTEWSRLSPADRARARLNFQEVRQLSPEERQSQWDAYRSLTPAQRRELAERAQSRPAPVAAPRRENGGEKSALVRSPASPQPQPVGPTVVQRGAGATTSLVSKPTRPPLHQQAGLPKVAATPGFVDADTLLPQRGAQGAARPQRSDDRRGKNTNDSQ